MKRQRVVSLRLLPTKNKWYLIADLLVLEYNNRAPDSIYIFFLSVLSNCQYNMELVWTKHKNVLVPVLSFLVHKPKLV